MSRRPTPPQETMFKGYPDALALLRSPVIDTERNLSVIHDTPFIGDLPDNEIVQCSSRLRDVLIHIPERLRVLYEGLRVNPYQIDVEESLPSMASFFYTDSSSSTRKQRAKNFYSQIETKLYGDKEVEGIEDRLRFAATAHIAVELLGYILPHVWEDAHLKATYLTYLLYYAALEQASLGFRTNTYVFLQYNPEDPSPDFSVLQGIKPILRVEDVEAQRSLFFKSLFEGYGVTPIQHVVYRTDEFAYFGLAPKKED